MQRGDGRLWWLSGAWLRPISAPCAWAEPASALVLPDNGQVRVSGFPTSLAGLFDQCPRWAERVKMALLTHEVTGRTDLDEPREGSLELAVPVGRGSAGKS